MSSADRPSGPQLDPLFAAAKTIDPIAEAARERALTRARATVARADGELPVARPLRLRLALAAGVVLALAATGAVAAFLRRAPAAPVDAADPAADATRHGGIDLESDGRGDEAADQGAVVARPDPAAANPPALVDASSPHRARPPHVHASAQPELALIQRAQTSYAEGNLPAALELLAEHARRFPNGRLAEEREALRIRSLARCGRGAEARHALRAFADRFPHSILLPHLREALAGGQP